MMKCWWSFKEEGEESVEKKEVISKMVSSISKLQNDVLVEF